MQDSNSPLRKQHRNFYCSIERDRLSSSRAAMLSLGNIKPHESSMRHHEPDLFVLNSYPGPHLFEVFDMISHCTDRDKVRSAIYPSGRANLGSPFITNRVFVKSLSRVSSVHVPNCQESSSFPFEQTSFMLPYILFKWSTSCCNSALVSSLS
jgi:hypothetical protein